MKRIRILFADDSAAVRRLLKDKLGSCPDMEVVGAARDGKEAVGLFHRLKPDVVLLDVEMPVMDGIEALKAIRSVDRRVPVLMFSSLTVKGAEATLDALAMGASDYVSKPTGANSIQQAMEYMDRELLPHIRQWGDRPSPATATPVAITPSQPTKASLHPTGRVDVVAIGSSTGGPNALSDIVRHLPGDLGVPVLITQHMPSVFTKLLAERLDKVTPLSVTEAAEGDRIERGKILIAPGDYHMVVKRAGRELSVGLNQQPPENSCRPAVDVTFRSVADAYQGNTLAIVLTGMGKDGKQGCEVLKRKGATIIAQDQSSSVVWGMPRAVAEAGLADKVLPLTQIHSEITFRGRKSPVPAMAGT